MSEYYIDADVDGPSEINVSDDDNNVLATFYGKDAKFNAEAFVAMLEKKDD